MWCKSVRTSKWHFFCEEGDNRWLQYVGCEISQIHACTPVDAVPADAEVCQECVQYAGCYPAREPIVGGLSCLV